MNSNNIITTLYAFLVTNSIIYGLFGLFVPVFLYSLGYTFSEISLFIVFNSIAFLLSLRLVEYSLIRFKLKYNLSLSFIWYLGFLSTVFFLEDKSYFLLLLGVFSGFYNSFFWILQRILFVKSITEKNVGKMFSNVQLTVVFISKVAIIVGSFLLEKNSFNMIFYISIILIFFSLLILLFKNVKGLEIKHKLLSFKEIISFKDNYNSKLIFFIDGIFLFLESYFWILVVFIYVDSNYLGIGTIIIGTVLFFSIIYYFIRKIIDLTNSKKLFMIVSILYSFSWFLRVFFDSFQSQSIQYIIIAFIGFFTILFRLVYNKVFFKIAKHTQPINYILLKSYYSQFIIIFAFLFFAFLFKMTLENKYIFSMIFSFFGFFSLIYLFQKTT